jgi:hypothetical protein
VLTVDTGDCARGVEVSAGIELLVLTGWSPFAARGAFSYSGSLSKPSLALIADISTWVALETVIVVFADLKRLGWVSIGGQKVQEEETYDVTARAWTRARAN